jgi:hypothetical protein
MNTSMNAAELHAKAVIVAALITSHAVDIPRLQETKLGAPDEAAIRLRLLTEYVYRAIATADA